MSVYHVRLVETYAPDAGHPWSITRTLVSAETGPCLAPVLVRLGRHRVPCSRRLPHTKQCRNCAPVIVVTETRRITA